jgi:pSer/pThr/pTyr-binding forkhead associated (FHA) protein
MQARLVRQRSSDTGENKSFPLLPAGTAIGRGADNLVQLPDAAVSKRHAVIRFEDEAWELEDLDSRNGSVVNGNVVRGKVQLMHGDKIRIGHYDFIFEADHRPDSRLPEHFINFSSSAEDQTIDEFVVPPEDA